jgi:branched-chain amino acid transport system substrate-binding protein
MRALSRREFLRVSGTGLAGIALLGAAGCGGQGGAGGDGPIRIGVAIPLSGALATEGKITKEGYDVWAEKVNEGGGIQVGNAQRRVELKYYDDQSNPQTGSRLVQRLVSQDSINLLLSGYGTENIMAESIAAQRAGAIMINAGGASDTLYETGNERFFGTVPLARDYYDGFIELVENIPEDERPKTAAYAFSNETYTTQLAESARNGAEKIGIETVFYEAWSGGTRDLSGILTQAKRANPDMLVTGTHVGDGIQAVQTLQRINFAPKIVGVAAAIPTTQYAETLGKTGDYIVGPSNWAPELPQKDMVWGDRETFVKEYTKKTGRETVDYHVPMAASAAEVLQYGIQETDSLDPGEIAQAIHETQGINTLFGTLTFTETGAPQGIDITQVQRYDDKVNLVWPKEYADQLVYPMPPWSER